MHHDGFSDAGLCQQRVEGHEESSSLSLLIQAERIEHGAEVVEDQERGAGAAESRGPVPTDMGIKQIERGHTAPQRNGMHAIHLADTLIRQPGIELPLARVISAHLRINERQRPVDGHHAVTVEEVAIVYQGPDHVADERGLPRLELRGQHHAPSPWHPALDSVAHGITRQGQPIPQRLERWNRGAPVLVRIETASRFAGHAQPDELLLDARLQ